MADSDNDLETRVGILEREVARLREQAVITSSAAAAARVLAAGADHDVSEVRSELRAHTRALNALRETQLEQGEAITSLGGALAQQGKAISGIHQELTEHGRAIVSLDQKMSAGFATLNTGMTKITALLENAGPEQE